jgi:hypothetical protein
MLFHLKKNHICIKFFPLLTCIALEFVPKPGAIGKHQINSKMIPVIHYFLLTNTSINAGEYTAQCISAAGLAVKMVAVMDLAPCFASMIFQPFRVFARCFSAAGLEQMFKTCICIYVRPARPEFTRKLWDYI